MIDIVGKKYWYFLISLLVIIPGIISLILFRLNLSIDFAGGSQTQYQISNKQSLRSNELSKGKYQIFENELKNIYRKQNLEISSIQRGESLITVRTKTLDQKIYQKIKENVKKNLPSVREVSFQTIGPTIGRETTENAVKALILASVLIVLYITWSFRSVPKPASSIRFGICAIIALIHDVLVVVGIFSILGHFLKVEVDSLFVTALLTIIGFSVHDTIVVFDRIRENLQRMGSSNFSYVVNESINQTLVRSLNTSLTVILVLVGLLLFGGESIKWFVVALLVGIISGTYSSIFNASPLLVIWQEWSRRKD